MLHRNIKVSCGVADIPFIPTAFPVTDHQRQTVSQPEIAKLANDLIRLLA